jgi:hypothetical protein
MRCLIRLLLGRISEAMFDDYLFRCGDQSWWMMLEVRMGK